VVAWRVSPGDRLVDLHEWTARDRHRRGASASEREVTFTDGVAHDVSVLPGAGRHFGSQPRAKTSMTIMRAPQCGHGQGSIGGASAVNLQAGRVRLMAAVPRPLPSSSQDIPTPHSGCLSLSLPITARHVPGPYHAGCRFSAPSLLRRGSPELAPGYRPRIT
jgi:hypothetical protein